MSVRQQSTVVVEHPSWFTDYHWVAKFYATCRTAPFEARTYAWRVEMRDAMKAAIAVHHAECGCFAVCDEVARSPMFGTEMERRLGLPR